MSKIKADHVFTSESVSEGHPDKICDQISDAVLDACLEKDDQSRVACETLVTTDFVLNAGEITSAGYGDLDTDALVRNVVREIGYDRPELGFCADTLEYMNRIHEQSGDIAQGVTAGTGLHKEQGAGDQGMMFGYATNETPELMPAPIAYSHKILQRLRDCRKNGELPYLRPDSKSQVSIRYIGGRPDHVTAVVVSHQTDEVDSERIENDIVRLVNELLSPTGLLTKETVYHVNPTGRFVNGGPNGDAGVTGRKIIVDTYGGVGSHGGGAFSGKDPSKVDRSAAYYARYAAKNVVAAGLAEKCEIQIAYAIGVAEPLSINVDTYGTGLQEDGRLEEILLRDGIFDFRPASIVAELGLLKPEGWSYRQTAAYGHFGREHFPWEQTDKVELLRNVV